MFKFLQNRKVMNCRPLAQPKRSGTKFTLKVFTSPSLPICRYPNNPKRHGNGRPHIHTNLSKMLKGRQK